MRSAGRAGTAGRMPAPPTRDLVEGDGRMAPPTPVQRHRVPSLAGRGSDRRKIEGLVSDSPFGSAARYQPAEYFDLAGSRVARRFGDVADEYALLRESAGLVDRGDRAILRVTGADRATWLHNMVTNAVRTLDPGSGVYAFACDAKGRVQFDVNILMLTDAILLDLDRAVLDRALAHLNRFLIMEAAELFD